MKKNVKSERKNWFVKLLDKMSEMIESCQWFPVAEQMYEHTSKYTNNIKTDTEAL